MNSNGRVFYCNQLVLRGQLFCNWVNVEKNNFTRDEHCLKLAKPRWTPLHTSQAKVDPTSHQSN